MEIDTGYFDIDEANRSRMLAIEFGQPSQSKVITEGCLSHLIKGYPTHGWGNVKNSIKPMGEIKGEATFKYEWGDKDGNKFTFEASASAKDDNGNYVEVSASESSDGTGDVGCVA